MNTLWGWHACTEDILHSRSREAGVRNLKKLLEKIYRKAALKLVKRGVQAPPKAEVMDAAPEKQAPGARCVAALPRTCSFPSVAPAFLSGTPRSVCALLPLHIPATVCGRPLNLGSLR